MISKKICMVGDFSVGKTSLIRRFVERQFSDQYLSTVGVKISRKTVTVEGKKAEKTEVQLLIWDLEGSTKFKGIAPSYLQGSTGILVVADVTRPDTVEHLEDHIQLFLSVNPKGMIMVAFNKSDLIEEAKLAKILAQYQFSHQPQVQGIYATSAKTGQDVDNIFQSLAEKII